MDTIVKDAVVANHGSVVVITPLTEAAREWVAENVETEMWWCGGFVVEPRYAGPIIDGMEADGLEVAA